MEKSIKDLYDEMQMMRAVDPRPINTGDRSKNFVRYLVHSGYLPESIEAGDLDHLCRKIDGYIREAILSDRKDRIAP